ncbi:MAG: nucleotidyltransferase domain-containing protein [Eubacterium sp.]|jgi:predicted nucleotidyltransferase|nr:nucleotidyltransferase domain-containing protein [Eubacterium sp.]
MDQIYSTVFGNDIVKILLYGSYARGDFREGSDIDIAAIVMGNRKELQDGLKEIWNLSEELEVEYGVIVSPTVIPYEEFEKFKTDLPYYRNILKEGVDIRA